MLSLIMALFIIWLLWKLGIGIIKIVGFLFLIGLVFVFVSYLVVPILALVLIGSLVGFLIRA
ncbi:hypothetical protein [Lactobacillus hominis]|uniref:Uncharacterized protein n=1 Tax=Lactobacillus hominis DSM 23910 = CRBIP 24.179 TaxID=1423758 RepID=I7IW62_9LACO|nr:hypothetical protein [Lactobacillus hominis]MCT3347746.1 hypothetical protein [Lactobacillus hominis]CCI82598.1 Protein of unknown function [Lactobacillus hominis DSM 23910 = CRBIP 24.179]